MDEYVCGISTTIEPITLAHSGLELLDMLRKTLTISGPKTSSTAKGWEFITGL